MFLIGQLLIIAAVWIPISMGFVDFDVQKFVLTQTTSVPAIGDIKMFRVKNSREIKFNATFKVTDDDLAKYDVLNVKVEANVYRSALGNNQFVASPYQLARKPLCDFLNNEFRNRIMDDVTKYSNLPSEHDKKINYCDLLKISNQYEVVNYIGDISRLPKYIPIGLYKVIGSLIDRNTNVKTLSVISIAKLY